MRNVTPTLRLIILTLPFSLFFTSLPLTFFLRRSFYSRWIVLFSLLSHFFLSSVIWLWYWVILPRHEKQSRQTLKRHFICADHVYPCHQQLPTNILHKLFFFYWVIGIYNPLFYILLLFNSDFFLGNNLRRNLNWSVGWLRLKMYWNTVEEELKSSRKFEQISKLTRKMI